MFPVSLLLLQKVIPLVAVTLRYWDTVLLLHFWILTEPKCQVHTQQVSTTHCSALRLICLELMKVNF